jgi:Fe-S cluster biogenesis protein NfuA
MTESDDGDFEDRVYAAVAAAEEQFRAEDQALLKRENFPFLDDSDYAAMIEHLAGTYKGVEIDWIDPYTKTVILKPEGGCSACAISTFHIQRAIGDYLTEHVDPDIHVSVRSAPQSDF